MKINSIHQQLPARRQAENPPGLPTPIKAAEGDTSRQGERLQYAAVYARPVNSVGNQRAIDFYVITEAISRPRPAGELIGVDTFA